MDPSEFNIILADDYQDDCLFVKEVLDELSLSATPIVVDNDEQLMHLLTYNQHKSGKFEDVVFLDLNMPHNSSFESLKEIKQIDVLTHTPITIFSTSLDRAVDDLFYNNGAYCCVQKPNDFSALKKIMLETLTPTRSNYLIKPEREQFIS